MPIVAKWSSISATAELLFTLPFECNIRHCINKYCANVSLKIHNKLVAIEL